MRIGLIGTVHFSVACLEATLQTCANTGCGKVVGIITTSLENNTYNSDIVDIHPYALAAEIECVQTRMKDHEKIFQTISRWNLDLLMVVGWSSIIPREIYSLPKIATVGSHPTLLPKGRGRHPIIWSIIKEVKQSGVSFFYIENDSADTGDIIHQEPFQIHRNDTAFSVYIKAEWAAKKSIPQWLPKMENQPTRIQQDTNLATEYPKRSEKDGVLCWTDSSLTIYNSIRALSYPYPGATTKIIIDGHVKIIVIWEAKYIEPEFSQHSMNAPGKIIDASDNHLLVACGTGNIIITRWTDTSGFKPLLKIGDHFASTNTDNLSAS